MKRKITLIVLLAVVRISPALAIGTASLGSPGELHFSLTINQGTCELEEENINVEMGSMLLPRPVAAGRVLSARDFSIGLKECGDVVRAYVSMDGTPDATDPSLFALDSGGASGVALKIADANGVQQLPLSAGGAAQEWNINANSSNTLSYKAQYIVTTPSAQSGRADATVNFSISYE